MDRDDRDQAGERPDNVVPFPRIGFDLTPAWGAGAGDGPTPMTTAPAGPAAPPPLGEAFAGGTDTLVLPATVRRSPLDTIAALTEAGTDAPGPTPLTAAVMPAATPGEVPATFRSEPGPVRAGHGAQLGALSLAAIIAVAVACLRGIHSAVTAWRANREQRQAVDRAAAAGGTGRGGKGRVQPAHEFGRQNLGRGGGSPKTAGGNGPGKGGSGRGGGHSPGRNSRHDRHDRKGGNHDKHHDKHHGGHRDHRGHGGRDRKQRPVHRTSQGGHDTLKHSKNQPHRDPKADRGHGRDRDSKRRLRLRDASRGGLLRNPNKHGKSDLSKRKGGGLIKDSRKNGRKTRTTLPRAIADQAVRRLKHRRTSMTPPLWSTKNRKSNDTGRKTAKDHRDSKGKGATKSPWSRIRSRARTYWNKRRGTYGYDTGATGGWAGPRRSPWEAAGMTTGETTYTTERTDMPGAQEQRWQAPAIGTGPRALPPAPTPHTQRPGTTRPTPAPAPPSPAAPSKEKPRMATTPVPLRPRAVPGMHAQHETDITLDDALDLLEELTADAFTAHDQGAVLAERARSLRNRLEQLAHDLAVHHNVIGQRTSAAMAHLAEAMDLLARKAEEMSVQSLQAAEATEAADTALGDAYRPITQATADAGLTVPSAAPHNAE